MLRPANCCWVGGSQSVLLSTPGSAWRPCWQCSSSALQLRVACGSDGWSRCWVAQLQHVCSSRVVVWCVAAMHLNCVWSVRSCGVAAAMAVSVRALSPPGVISLGAERQHKPLVCICLPAFSCVFVYDGACAAACLAALLSGSAKRPQRSPLSWVQRRRCWCSALLYHATRVAAGHVHGFGSTASPCKSVSAVFQACRSRHAPVISSAGVDMVDLLPVELKHGSPEGLCCTRLHR
jgi:hypothetical protein